jgi:hypothetical protein
MSTMPPIARVTIAILTRVFIWWSTSSSHFSVAPPQEGLVATLLTPTVAQTIPVTRIAAAIPIRSRLISTTLSACVSTDFANSAATTYRAESSACGRCLNQAVGELDELAFIS